MKKIAETIKKLITEHGSGILEQEKRLIAILADLHPEEKRNRYLIELSLRSGIPKKLIVIYNENVANNDHKINSIKHFFKDEFFLEDGAVKLVFDCWVEALKLTKKSFIETKVKETPLTFPNLTLKLTKESYTENLNGVNLEMIAIKGGTFLMGSKDGIDYKNSVHNVTVSDFYLAKTQVTQAQWKAIMGNNPSFFKGDNLPVECVSWNDAQVFLSKLNAKTSKIYRLPTEAEWEYAAGGGENNRTIFAGTNYLSSLGDYVWYRDNSGGKTNPAGTKQPNQLGLYDMSGNVWEWCNDWYDSDYYAKSTQNNPKGASTGSSRVMRGGSWYNKSNLNFRVAACNCSNPNLRALSNNGFRCAMAL